MKTPISKQENQKNTANKKIQQEEILHADMQSNGTQDSEFNSQKETKLQIIFCIGNSKSRLMVHAITHYLKISGIDGDIFVLEKNNISQNQLYFSQKIDFTTRNHFIKQLNFIPIQTLDISEQVKSDIQTYHQKFRLHPNKTFEKMNSNESSKQTDTANPDVTNPDIVFFLNELRMERFNVRFHSDTEEGVQSMLQILDPFVGGVEKNSVSVVQGNKITYGAATNDILGFLKGYFESLGISPIKLHQGWDDSDREIVIQMQDPAIQGKPIKEWMPMLISSDDPILEQEIVTKFYEQGFKKVRMATEQERRQNQLGFTIFENSLKKQDPKGEITVEIQNILTSILQDSVNLQDYPIQIESGQVFTYGCLLHIPIQAYRDGMSPYAGDGVGSYPIILHTNVPDVFAPFQKIVKDMGYNILINYTDDIEVANISYGLFSKHAQATTLIHTIERYIHDRNLTRNMYKISDIGIPNKSNKIFGYPITRDLDSKEIHISIHEHRPSRPNRRHVHFARRFRVVVNIDESENSFHLVREQLEELGIRKIEGRGRIPDSPADNTIHFGMAPSYLITQIIAKLENFFDMEEQIQTEETFLSEDRDIYVFLPKKKIHQEKNIHTFDPRAWLHRPKEQPTHKNNSENDSENDLQDILEIMPFLGPPSFIRNHDNKLQIGNQFLDMKERYHHPLTPQMKNFEHYCLDTQTAILCERICESVNFGEPLLLEGVTSTSKTSSILFLAACIGQPTIRINLSGATDVSEFVGRFIPDENRAGNGWCWEDGPIVKAMLEGYWVILDELNLAETSILERLNSILEANPKLLLSEHNDRLIGSSEYPLHEDFRVFATQNPVTYAGRNPLSPAYRDRFHEIQVQDPNMDPHIMEGMLNWIVFGEAPKIDVFGCQYQGDYLLSNRPKLDINNEYMKRDTSKTTETSKKIKLLFDETGEEHHESISIKSIPEMKEFLHCVSIFHSSLCSACSEEHQGIAALGIHRTGGYAFTRRGLIRLLNYIDHSINMYEKMPSKDECVYILKQSLTRTYLERVDKRDAEQVANLLDAAGIGPNTWII